jgi:hypothetical protein
MTHTPVITALKNRDRRFEPFGIRTEFWETAEKVGNEIDPSGDLQRKVREELVRQALDRARRRRERRNN